MRIGLREGLLEEAIAAAFEAPIEDVRRGPDAGRLSPARPRRWPATIALERGGPGIGRPIRFMLATPVADAAEVMRRVGDEAWIEDKYDGIRAQLHLRRAGEPRLFSRDLNDITAPSPRWSAAARGLGRRRSSTASWSRGAGGSVLDFASACRRGWGGSNPGPELLEQVPVVLVAFDLLHTGRRRPAGDAAARAAGGAGRARRFRQATDERMLLSHLAAARSAARGRIGISTTRASGTTRA